MSKLLAAQRSVTELVTQIWRGSLEVHDVLVQRGYGSALDAVADRLGYHPDGCDEAGCFMLMAVTFVSRVEAGPEQQRLHKLVAERLPRRARHLYERLLQTPLQVWNVPSDGVGQPLIGPESHRERPLAGIVTYGGRPRPGAYAGWPVLWEGHRFLILAVELSPLGVALVEQLPGDIEVDEGVSAYEAFWERVLYFVVDAVIEPTYDYQPPEPEVLPPLEERVDVTAWASRVMNLAESRGRGQLRLEVARATSEVGVEAIIDVFRRLRVAALPPWETYRRDDPEVEQALPMPALLGLYGLTPQGTLFGERLEAFERWPLRVLGLDAGLLDRARLEPHQPLGALDAWRRTRASDADRDRVDEAVARFRAEERWLATLLASRAQGASFAGGMGYDTVMHGFAKLFEPELLDAPLSSLGLSGGTLGRLQKAFERAKRFEMPETLGDLPQRSKRLLAIRGIGDATLGELAEALIDHALAWRVDRARLDPTRREAPQGLSDEAEDDLRSGLEELEKLLQ